MKTIIFFFVLSTSFAFGQTFGPNDPTTAVNDAAIGSNAWSNPTRVFTSNNSRATVSTLGVTNYVKASNFGFAIPSPANIDGIRVSVEKSHIANNVAILNTWTSGLTKTITAGTQRCLVVVAAIENGNNTRNITNMTYGGVNMTPVNEISIGSAGGFHARLEVWILLEAGIASAASTTIVPTYAAFTSLEYCETFSAATFQFVDQTTPVFHSVASGLNNNTNPHQLGANLNVSQGGMALNFTMTGNNGTYTINSGYTEGADVSFFHPSFSTTGATLQTAQKAITTDGTERPSSTFSATVNRHAMIGVCLQRGIIEDNEIRVMKGGVFTPSNLKSASPWPVTETAISYGSATELWGTTWTLADINATNFGVALSADIENGTASVDHMTITVFSTSTLPVELIGFQAVKNGRNVDLTWHTGSELNNDRFVIERSEDGLNFEEIGSVSGVGTSSSLSSYAFIDENAQTGVNYYRLKQIDFDGQFEYSPITFVEMSSSTLFAYPNPSNGTMQLNLADLKADQIEIYTVDFKFVKRVGVNGLDTNPVIQIENEADGTYYAFIQTNEGVKVVQIQKNSFYK